MIRFGHDEAPRARLMTDEGPVCESGRGDLTRAAIYPEREPRRGLHHEVGPGVVAPDRLVVIPAERRQERSRGYGVVSHRSSLPPPPSRRPHPRPLRRTRRSPLELSVQTVQSITLGPGEVPALHDGPGGTVECLDLPHLGDLRGEHGHPGIVRHPGVRLGQRGGVLGVEVSPQLTGPPPLDPARVPPHVLIQPDRPRRGALRHQGADGRLRRAIAQASKTEAAEALCRALA